MILFSLRCRAGHEFEGWFRDGAAFDAQSAAGEIACPDCGDRGVAKALMAPRLQRMGKSEQMAAEAGQTLRELRREVERNCDYVGDRFAEEARRIHYGETDPHNIYGEATSDEAASLSEEGIGFGRIPWLPREDA